VESRARQQSPPPAVYVELKDGSNVFPLYLYPTDDLAGRAEAKDTPGGRRPNIAPNFIEEIGTRLGLSFVPDRTGDLKKTFGPEDILRYMYAIFYSLTYRSRYFEFLRSDFPRLPLTSDVKLFRTLCTLGTHLIDLHLFQATGKRLPSFPVKGDGMVEKAIYIEPKREQPGRVWINETQYFENVLQEIWDQRIGGYQVCEKWLKDRKGRTLNYEDVQHYQRIVAAIGETISLMVEIDSTIEKHGGWPLK
jgi:hypothetical protein